MGPERDMSYFTGTAESNGAADGPARPAPAESAVYPAYPLPTARPAGRPLTQRLRRGHWIAIDCVLGAFFALCDLFSLTHGDPLPQQVFRPLWLLFGAVVFCSVGLRRRAPGTAFGALLLLGLLMAGVAPHASVLIFLSAAYVLYTVTVTSSKRTGAAALALVLAAIVGISATAAHSPADREAGIGGQLVPVALANVIGWIAGYSVRQRRLYIVSLQHEAASSAVAEERLRIARELHDVVAHSMSVIAVQAGYGQYVIDVSPDGARDALGAIQATSRDALDEMRRMLGVLRQQNGIGNPAGMPGASAPIGPAGTEACAGRAAAEAAGRLPADGRPVDAAPLAPAPGMGELSRLIQRTGGAGIQVSLTVTGQRRPLPAGVDLSAYRIIQEALTNVVKHAGVGAACTVEVYYGATVLGVRVTDNGAGRQGEYSPVMTAGPGHGLIGMRERAHLCGGEFDASPLADGGFQVGVTLPVPAADGLAGTDSAGTDSAGSGAGHDDRAAASVAGTARAGTVGAGLAEGQR